MSYDTQFRSAQTSLVSGGKMLYENGKYQCAQGRTWTAVGKRSGKSVGNRG